MPVHLSLFCSLPTQKRADNKLMKWGPAAARCVAKRQEREVRPA